jgi:hypothetical protein
MEKEEQKVEQKEEKKVETAPTTLTGLFIAEYYDLKEENKGLKKEIESLKEDTQKEIEEWKEDLNRMTARYMVYLKALKALRIAEDKDGYISIKNFCFGKYDDGYADLKAYLEKKRGE